MAYNYRASGIKFIGFDGQEIQTFFEQELFDDAQSLIERLAVATGNSPELDPGKITGLFAIVFERDQDGNGVIGLQPGAAINADIINAGN